jgi:hypothetical protein
VAAAHTFSIVERESILAVVLMAVKVLLWDKEIHDIYDVSEIGKVGLEMCLQMNVILACHVVGFDNSTEIFGALHPLEEKKTLKEIGKTEVGIRISDITSEICNMARV